MSDNLPGSGDVTGGTSGDVPMVDAVNDNPERMDNNNEGGNGGATNNPNNSTNNDASEVNPDVTTNPVQPPQLFLTDTLGDTDPSPLHHNMDEEEGEDNDQEHGEDVEHDDDDDDEDNNDHDDDDDGDDDHDDVDDHDDDDDDHVKEEVAKKLSRSNKRMRTPITGDSEDLSEAARAHAVHNQDDPTVARVVGEAMLESGSIAPGSQSPAPTQKDCKSPKNPKGKRQQGLRVTGSKLRRRRRPRTFVCCSYWMMALSTSRLRKQTANA